MFSTLNRIKEEEGFSILSYLHGYLWMEAVKRTDAWSNGDVSFYTKS